MNIGLSTISKGSIEQCCDARPTSVVESLKQSKRSLEKRLDDVNKALEALESSPEVLKVLELLAKV